MYPEALPAHKSKSLEILLAPILLALPFIFGIIYTEGLTIALPTFHGTDEMTYHYPVILQFADQFPFFDISDYNSATTPLFHIVFALIGKVIGFEPYKLRFVNVLFSYTAILLLYRILTNRFRIQSGAALLFATLFELSPYFFGVSFILLTDNLALLLLMAFFYYYFRYDESKRLSTFLLSILFLTLTILTRQTFLYISLAVIVPILVDRTGLPAKIKLLIIASVSVIPLLFFFYVWEGPTPPSFKQEHMESSLINLRSLTFGLGVIGFYSLFLIHKEFFLIFLEKKFFFITVAALSIIYILFVPISHMKGDDGFIWRVSRYFPNVFGSSLIFYVLVPLGTIMFVSIWKEIGPDFKLIAIVTFLMSNLPHKLVFQKYYDISIILLLIFISARFKTLERFAYYRLLSLLFLFILYTIAYQVLEPKLR